MKISIIVYALFACVTLYLFEQVIDVSYVVKTSLKIILFAIIPIIYLKKNPSFSLFKNTDKKGLFIAFLVGIASFSIVLIAYYFLRQYIDLSHIVSELENKHITAGNFIFIGMYITFGNSFLEEFFFRGFIFFNLYPTHKKSAYLVSSLLFSFYHISIFATWFNGWLTVLALISLFVIGLIFNWLNTKSNSMVNSWIVHILADLAIIYIGLQLFQII